MTVASVPASIVARPAASVDELRGRRAVVGVPGIGFRGDLRADNPVLRDQRTFVPVLTEHDFYRAEFEQIEAFALLVPVERVWIEQLVAVEATAVRPSALDEPGTRHPVPVLSHRSILGLRVVQAVPDGHVRELRAATDVYEHVAWGQAARICGEAEWYRWAQEGTVPSTVEVPVELLWLE